MSPVDLTAEIEIAAAPADIAAVMFDPNREPEWVGAVTAVDVVDKVIKPGARVKHSGMLLGQPLAWTTAVSTFHFPHRLVLEITEGPFTGTVTYDVQRSGTGSVARIRNTGTPRGLSFLPDAMIAGPMKAAMDGDLKRLKEIVEKSKS